MSPTPRVLIVKLSSLGDVIHAMPVVADLRSAFPGAQVDWVVEPGFAPLVRRVEGIGEVIECAQRHWRRRWWTAEVRAQRRAFRARLRAVAYDAVIDLQGLTKSALVAWQARLAPAGHRYALAHRTDGSGWEAPTRWVADRPLSVERHIHVVDRSRQIVALALGGGADDPPRFGLGRARPAPPGAAPCMVWVHGTSRDDKLWPEDRWLAFGRRRAAEGWRIALPQGSDEEAARAARLAQALGLRADGRPVAEVWPRMPLDALAGRMAACQAAIGVDSGLSHLAVALDLPHVQIYNFPTAWRTGPRPEHGHRHQCSVGEGDGPPQDAAVETAWLAVWRAAAGVGRA